MNNFFYLCLDTTPPDIIIYSPQNVLRGLYFEFRAVSNETISMYSAKIIDDAGNEFPITMQKVENEFIGIIDTFNLIPGMAKIQVTLFDEVFNKRIEEKAFKVISNHLFKLDFNLAESEITLISNPGNTFIQERLQVAEIESIENKMEIKEKISAVTFKVGDDDDV